MPTLEETLPTLSKAKLFTVIDAKDGFHQVKLDDTSSYLMTIWIPFGCYYYLCIPFGISSAPEEFKWQMHKTLQGLPGVEVIVDDILVFGCGDTEEEWQRDHNANLQGLLQQVCEIKKKLKLCTQQRSKQLQICQSIPNNKKVVKCFPVA